jgi:hypothetical protein
MQHLTGSKLGSNRRSDAQEKRAGEAEEQERRGLPLANIRSRSRPRKLQRSRMVVTSRGSLRYCLEGGWQAVNHGNRSASACASGQPRRDRRGRTDIVKGRSVQSAGNVLTMLSCSASGIFAICCALTRATITRLARTFQSTRTPRCREQYMPLVALCPRHFLADSIICMCVFDFRQASIRD